MNPRAAEADRLLKSELFNDVIKEVRESLKDRWEHEASAANRETLHAELRVIPLFIQEIKKIRGQGAVDDHNNRRNK